MKNIFYVLLIFLNIVSAREKMASIGFYLKPGINFISKNTFTQNTNATAAVEWGIGTFFIINKKNTTAFTLEYTNFETAGISKIDSSNISFDLKSVRSGFYFLFPVIVNISLRMSTGISFNKSNVSSDILVGYYSGLGFEGKLNDKGLSCFFEFQYDLVNFQDKVFNGNLGGSKLFIGLKYIAINKP